MPWYIQPSFDTCFSVVAFSPQHCPPAPFLAFRQLLLHLFRGLLFFYVPLKQCFFVFGVLFCFVFYPKLQSSAFSLPDLYLIPRALIHASVPGLPLNLRPCQEKLNTMIAVNNQSEFHTVFSHTLGTDHLCNLS